MAGDERGNIGFAEENLAANFHKPDFAAGLEPVERANANGDACGSFAPAEQDGSDVIQRTRGLVRACRWLA